MLQDMAQTRQGKSARRYAAWDIAAGREGMAKLLGDGRAVFYPGEGVYGMICMAEDLLLGEPEDTQQDEDFWCEVAQMLLTKVMDRDWPVGVS